MLLVVYKIHDWPHFPKTENDHLENVFVCIDIRIDKFNFFCQCAPCNFSIPSSSSIIISLSEPFLE